MKYTSARLHVGTMTLLAFVALVPTFQRADVDPWPVLDRASASFDTVRTLQADFIQIIENPMLGDPDTTRGKLFQRRPNYFAMRFSEPKNDRIVADGRRLWLYTAYVRADSLPDGAVDVIALTPRAKDLPYSAATVWISRRDGLVRRIDLVETSGQRRTITLQQLSVNRAIAAREFRFSPTSGVRVVDQ